MSDQEPINVNIDFEKPNPMAMEITKMMLGNGLISFGTDTKKATITFTAMYIKVLSEIKQLEANHQDLQALVEAAFSELGPQNLS